MGADTLETNKFTYKIPDNFKHRVYQILQRRDHSIAEAFRKCSYEYDDIGWAHRAGVQGDNWNKHAVDFTFEGPKHYITILEKYDTVLKRAVKQAIKSSESGYLVRHIFYFENSVEPLDSDEGRLNADLVTARRVLSDLIQIAERICSNSLFGSESSENSINDYFRDMLSMRGYNEVKDQTRHGKSVTGNDAGEVDILLTEEGKEIAIYEGLKLNSVNQDYINSHIDKAIVNYNVLGVATFIVAYVSSADFEAFWERYTSHLKEYKFPLEIKRGYEESVSPNAATRVATMILTKDGYFPVYYLAINVN